MTRQRGEQERFHIRREKRPTSGQRVGARADRSAYDAPVTSNPSEHVTVHCGGQSYLPLAGPNDHDLVQRVHLPAGLAGDLERGKQARDPIAAAETVERGDNVTCSDRREYSQTPARKRKHRAIRVDTGAHRRQGSSIAPDREEEIALLGFARLRNALLLPAGKDLHELGVVQIRPPAQLVE
jgi:hypothetical protein